MKLPIEGSCQCGDVTYKLSKEPILTYACHCKDCQKRTGSAFSLGMLVSTSAVEIDGKLSVWERTSDEGNTNTRLSCHNCGNIIYGVSSLSPDLLKLQPGTLTDTTVVMPEVHIWIKRSQPWLTLPDDVPKYEEQPDNLSEIVSAAIKYRELLLG